MADDSTEPDGAKPRSLDDLDTRLRAARERETSKSGGETPQGPAAGIGVGLRIGIEMVSGVAVGAAIGWGLDRWLGTKPWLMVLFFFLGAAAGILNAYRASTGMDDSVGFGAAQERRRKKGRE